MRGRWIDANLDGWRLVGDPIADPLARALFDEHGPAALGRLTRQLDDWEAPLPDDLLPAIRKYFDAPVVYPPWVDPSRIRHAEDLFTLFGPMTVSMLLLAGYPRFLTCPAGAHAMYAARVFSPESVASRMLEIAQFALFMGERGGLSVTPGDRGAAPRYGRGAMSYRKLRIVHANIRLLIASDYGRQRWDAVTLGVPINQEDLALGMLCFCLGPIEGLQKAGFALSPEDQEAMLMGWRTAAWLLGLVDDLQPTSVAEAILLRDTILGRHQRKTTEGAAVMREVLHVIDALLPPGTRRIPAALVRFQIGPREADLLDVPNPRWLVGLIESTQPLWRSTRLFAGLTRIVSPRLLAWAASPGRLGGARRLEVPAALAARLRGDR